jgi:hypothetical protein
MLFFGISLAVGVVAVLGAQKLNIDGLNPPAARAARKRKASVRAPAPASVSFAPGTAFLRQQ